MHTPERRSVQLSARELLRSEAAVCSVGPSIDDHPSMHECVLWLDPRAVLETPEQVQRETVRAAAVRAVDVRAAAVRAVDVRAAAVRAVDVRAAA